MISFKGTVAQYAHWPHSSIILKRVYIDISPRELEVYLITPAKACRTSMMFSDSDESLASYYFVHGKGPIS